MSIAARHVATVEPYLGGGAYGDRYDTAAPVPCVYEGLRQLVRASDGSEAVSEGRFFCDLPGTEAQMPDGTTVVVPDIPPGSRASVQGRETWVITVATFDGRYGQHLEVAVA